MYEYNTYNEYFFVNWLSNPYWVIVQGDVCLLSINQVWSLNVRCEFPIARKFLKKGEWKLYHYHLYIVNK